MENVKRSSEKNRAKMEMGKKRVYCPKWPLLLTQPAKTAGRGGMFSQFKSAPSLKSLPVYEHRESVWGEIRVGTDAGSWAEIRTATGIVSSP